MNRDLFWVWPSLRLPPMLPLLSVLTLRSAMLPPWYHDDVKIASVHQQKDALQPCRKSPPLPPVWVFLRLNSIRTRCPLLGENNVLFGHQKDTAKNSSTTHPLSLLFHSYVAAISLTLPILDSTMVFTFIASFQVCDYGCIDTKARQIL